MRLMPVERVLTVRVVATAAMRDARNAPAFQAWVKAETGWTMEVISGLEEGRLIHRGVMDVEPGAGGRVLLIDLGGEHTVSDVQVRFVGSPTAARLYVGSHRPTGVPAGTPAASGTADGTTLDLAPTSTATGRYVLLWLTQLPAVTGGFRGQVAEVSVRGR